MKNTPRDPRVLIALLVVLLVLGYSTEAQINLPSPAATPKLSQTLSKNLENFERDGEVPRIQREQAYAKLMEGQRYIWRMNSSRAQSGNSTNVRLARAALVKALELDPGLAEGYTALAELSVSAPPSDVDEAIELASMGVRVRKDNFGAHKILARLLTFKSNLNSGRLDLVYAAKAIEEWKEVARLDPRNAEAWAFLSEFYEQTGKENERIDALRKWLAASPPLENQFYRRVMGGREDLSPERASLKLASALQKSGRVREAVEVLNQILADEPENAEAVELLAQTVESSDEATSALAVDSLQQAVFANPGNIALIKILAQIQARIGRTDDAVRGLNETAVKLATNDKSAAAELYLLAGDILAEADRHSEAASAYENAINIRGIGAANALAEDEREFALQAFEKLITAYKRADRVADARAAILRARRSLGRNDLFADKQLVSLLRETGRRSQALASLRSLRLRDPADMSLLRLEASLLTEMGQVDRAVALMKAPPVSARRTRSRTGQGQNGNPVALRNPAYDEFSNLLFISQLYSDAKRGKEAIASAERAYELAGGAERRQIAKLMVATAQQMSGDFGAAETTLRDILKESPGNPIALNNLGYFLLERGERFEEALDLIERAVKVDPTNPSYLDSLGWAHFKLHNYDQAENYLRQAARIDSTSAAIHEHLGDVYRQLGKRELARASWSKALQLSAAGADSKRVKGKLAALK